ncbi:hypothetical protein QP445_14600, partial [Micrococcus luteus]|nr:hypothetical protein [Micrococcus luteus]
DMEKTVNGVKPHYQNLKGLITLYNQFDKLVCVSDASKEQNMRNIAKKALNKKFVASRNTINLSKISQFMLDDSDQFEKNNVPVLVSVNKGKVTSV